VADHRGSGTLSGVTTVQRINTQGGVHAGSCEKAGTFYSAHTEPTTSFCASDSKG
jgi:hypothetical protein